MKKEKRTLAAAAFLLAAVSARAETNEQGPWARRLAPILKSEHLKPGTYGVEVRALADGKLLFADGADLPLNPASGIKVLTSSAALSKLGPDFRFRTGIARAGKDLCLIGRGDPSLVNETVWLLAEETGRAGVTEVAGDLIADETYFPASRGHLGDFSGDEERAFTAPVGALSVNFNSLTVYGEPTEIGKPPRIMLDPDLPLFHLINRAKTSRTGTRKDLAASVEKKGDRFTVTAAGKVAAAGGRVAVYRAIPDPALYTGHLFADSLRKNGIAVRGKIRKAACPSTAAALAEFNSKPLSQIVFDLNKFSNNFIAEMLLRAIGNEPTAESGIETMKAWLKTRGIDAPELAVENGSGLSRKTRVSARTLAAVVRSAANDLAIGPEFLSSFGIGGVDGTLRRRFNGSPTGLSVRAKSGSLNGTVSLTGVVQTPEGKAAAFSFIFNGAPGRQWDLQKLEERLIRAMAAPGGV